MRTNSQSPLRRASVVTTATATPPATSSVPRIALRHALKLRRKDIDAIDDFSRTPLIFDPRNHFKIDAAAHGSGFGCPQRRRTTTMIAPLRAAAI